MYQEVAYFRGLLVQHFSDEVLTDRAVSPAKTRQIASGSRAAQVQHGQPDPGRPPVGAVMEPIQVGLAKVQTQRLGQRGDLGNGEGEVLRRDLAELARQPQPM